MRRRPFASLLALVLSVSPCLCGALPAPIPKNPTAVWWQPARNVPMLAAQGVNVFFGPEVENRSNLSAAVIAVKEAEWVRAVADAGGVVVLKRPSAPVPANCAGFVLDVDEPNAKKVAPAALQANFDALRKLDPAMPIFLSMYGGAVTSANLARPAELQLLKDYASLCDVFTVDVYAKNLNAPRYPTTWTGDAIQKLAGATGKPVWGWIEMNDQQLPAPKAPDFNRGPTAVEIKASVEYAVEQGAAGVGWFATCASGKYGWGVVDPARGDSYWPLVDRNKASIAEPLAMVRAIGLARRNSAATRPAEVVALEARVGELEGRIGEIARLAAAATRPAEVQPSTQPTTTGVKP